jgi:hypothetical protein
MGLRRVTSFQLLTRICIQPTNKLVSSLFRAPSVLGQATSNYGLAGSHHLPPYSILCASPQHLHPNGFLSRDSQGGVPKLSQFGLPPLCEIIIFFLNLWLGWGLKQTCSSHRELCNGVSHFTYTHRGRVDSQLLVVGNQIVSLTLGLFLS